MKIYSSDEFIREKYLKIDTKSYLFDDFAQNLAEYVTGFYILKKKYGLTPSSSTNMETGRVDIFDYYGIKTRVENTGKGGKFVMEFSPGHSIHIYPVCDDGANATEIGFHIPKDSTVDIYAVSNGKAKKLLTGLDANLISNPNQRGYRGMKDRFDERNKAGKAVKSEIDSWGLSQKYNTLNAALEKAGEEYQVRLDRENEANKRKREEASRLADMNRERAKQGVVLEFAKDGIPFEPGCEYRFRDWTDNSFRRPAGKGARQDAEPEMTFSVLIRQLLKEYCRKELQETFDNPKHPDSSGIDNFIKKYKKYIYSPRALKEDNYLLVDYFRNKKQDIPCQHCGKEKIVNIMVIEAPDGKRYLVGSDCVFRLAKMPWDVFEEKWNKPFTMAQRILDMTNKDKKLGWPGNWYVQKNEDGKEMFVYAASRDNPLDCEWFYIPDVKRDPSYKPHRRESHTRLLSEGFMKRMLPDEYTDALYTNVDIVYILDCIYPTKEMLLHGYNKFSFCGVDYDLNKYEYNKKITLLEEDKHINIGEFSVDVENDGGLPKITVKFRNYTYTLKYKEQNG